ncbi:MAG: helix-turn-helix transcriptional regulator [Saprospiraceae bacterium]
MITYKIVKVPLQVPDDADINWVEALNEMLTPLLSDYNLSVVQLTEKLNISERHFGKLLKKNTGFTPAQYIKELRLQKAKVLIEHKSYETIAEVSYAVGFLRPIYFSNEFRKRFGQLPSKLK